MKSFAKKIVDYFEKNIIIMYTLYNVYIIMMLGGNGMRRKFRVTKKMLQRFETLTYGESVKLYSALALLEKYGVTESILEMWGRGKNKSEYLSIPVSRTYKEGGVNGEIPEDIIHSITIDLSRV